MTGRGRRHRGHAGRRLAWPGLAWSRSPKAPSRRRFGSARQGRADGRDIVVLPMSGCAVLRDMWVIRTPGSRTPWRPRGGLAMPVDDDLAGSHERSGVGRSRDRRGAAQGTAAGASQSSRPRSSGGSSDRLAWTGSSLWCCGPSQLGGVTTRPEASPPSVVMCPTSLFSEDVEVAAEDGLDLVDDQLLCVQEPHGACLPPLAGPRPGATKVDRKQHVNIG